MLQLHCPPTLCTLCQRFSASSTISCKRARFAITVSAWSALTKRSRPSLIPRPERADYLQHVSLQACRAVFRCRAEASGRYPGACPARQWSADWKVQRRTHFAETITATSTDTVSPSIRAKPFRRRLRHGSAGRQQLRPLVPQGATMAELALRWILMFSKVTTTISGAKNPRQAEDNVKAASLPPLSEETMQRVRAVYDCYAREQVAEKW